MQPELLILNLNGVIIDVSRSELPAVRRTVQNYFARFLGIHGSGSLVSEADVEAFLLAGGFDHPWELSTGLIRYSLSLLPDTFRRTPPPRHAEEAAVLLKKRSRPLRHLSLAYLQERADFQGMAERVREAGGGLAALAGILGKPDHPLLMAGDGAGEGNLVRRLYQEIYLGRQIFPQVEGRRPQFHKGPGLVDNERLLLDAGTLGRLRKRYRGGIAIVTHWPHEMALRSLRAFNIANQYDTLITYEDVVSEIARARRRGEPDRLAKPHPFTLLGAAESLDYGGDGAAVYAGVTPDDVRMARAADQAGERPFLAWALLGRERDAGRWRQCLEEEGVQQCFGSIKELVAALLAP